ncbi:MAG: hypothetical protein ACREMY_02155, partial [bacterium]
MNMTIAPYKPCISCLKGDTHTAFVVSGSADFAVAVVELKAGLAKREAAGVVAMANAEGDRGTYAVRLCPKCAK